MNRRVRAALAMIGCIVLLGVFGSCSLRYGGCAEARVMPPRPTCDLPRDVTSPRAVAAALARGDRDWMLARDDEDGALAILGDGAVLVFPKGETREPAAALASFLNGLAPDARNALRRSRLLLLWLGRAQRGEQRYSAWDQTLDVQVAHDVLTPDGCLARVETADDPESYVNRHRANAHAQNIELFERKLAGALRDGAGPVLSADESDARRRADALRVRSVAKVGARQTYVPVSAIVIALVLLGFYWWAASGGKEASLSELRVEELRGDGALVAPGPFDLRVLSHSLLHRDVSHLGNNLFALLVCCVILEPALGSARTLIVFLASVVGGALVRLRLRKPGLTIGASGGVFGLEAAIVVLLLRSGMWFLPDERRSYFIYLGIQTALGLALSFLPGVSMAVHLGGALAGGLITLTGLVTLGRPPLDGGDESGVAAGLAWGLAGLGVALWVGAGILVQRGRADLDPESTR